MRARAAAGFTLTELAVVLAIVGLLLGGLTYTLSAQVQQRDWNETERRLAEARDLLLAFAVVNGRLPCPATTASAGDESPSGGGTCTTGYSGFLPAKAIGYLPTDSGGYALDAWGNRIRYALAQTLDTSVSGCTGPTLPHFTSTLNLKSNGITCRPNDLVVCAAWGGSTSGCGSAASVTNTQVVAAVLWSQGKNFSTVVSGGNDEAANNKTAGGANDHPVFVWHPPAPTGASAGEFDDQMTWIPVGVLYSRMIAAGALP